jgi:tight adherence protein B
MLPIIISTFFAGAVVVATDTLRVWLQSTRRAGGALASRLAWGRLGSSLLAGVFLAWMLQSVFVGLLGAASLTLAPRWWRRRRRQAELDAQARQMPGLLESLSAGLRAGFSLPQAVEASLEDLDAEAAAVALRLARGLRLGALPEELLAAEAAAAEGHPLAADWRLLATTVGIQRQSGGDLAGLLDQLCATLRERQRLQAQVQALTAQGRMSAWVVGLLPLVLLLALQLLDPELVAPLWSTGTGRVLLGLGVLLETVGVLLLKRIVDIQA